MLLFHRETVGGRIGRRVAFMKLINLLFYFKRETKAMFRLVLEKIFAKMFSPASLTYNFISQPPQPLYSSRTLLIFFFHRIEKGGDRGKREIIAASCFSPFLRVAFFTFVHLLSQTLMTYKLHWAQKYLQCVLMFLFHHINGESEGNLLVAVCISALRWTAAIHITTHFQFTFWNVMLTGQSFQSAIPPDWTRFPKEEK